MGFKIPAIKIIPIIGKSLFIFLFMLLSSLSFYGQDDISYGIKVGYNGIGFNDGSTGYLDGNGYHVGGIAELEMSDSFAVKGELLFDKKGGFLSAFQNGIRSRVDTKLDYICVPVFGKLTFVKNLSLEGGPQIGFLINEKAAFEDGTEAEIAETNAIEFSVGGGLSYEFLTHFVVQARYDAGISKVFTNTDTTNTTLNFSLGYMF